MKKVLLALTAGTILASTSMAGNWFGSGPWANATYYPGNLDGKYQAAVFGNNISGVLGFALRDGAPTVSTDTRTTTTGTGATASSSTLTASVVDPLQNYFVIFVEGRTYSGLTTAGINYNNNTIAGALLGTQPDFRLTTNSSSSFTTNSRVEAGPTINIRLPVTNVTQDIILAGTNEVINTNYTPLTNIVVSNLTMFITNTVTTNETVNMTNSVITTNIVAATNEVVSTNFLTATNEVISTNFLTATNEVVSTNFLTATNEVISTNFLTATNEVISTNFLTATNEVISTNFLTATNEVVSTNQVLVDSDSGAFWTNTYTTNYITTNLTTYDTNLVVTNLTTYDTNLVVTNFATYDTNLVVTNFATYDTNLVVTNFVTFATNQLVTNDVAYTTNVVISETNMWFTNDVVTTTNVTFSNVVESSPTVTTNFVPFFITNSSTNVTFETVQSNTLITNPAIAALTNSYTWYDPTALLNRGLSGGYRATINSKGGVFTFSGNGQLSTPSQMQTINLTTNSRGDVTAAQVQTASIPFQINGIRVSFSSASTAASTATGTTAR